MSWIIVLILVVYIYNVLATVAFSGDFPFHCQEISCKNRTMYVLVEEVDKMTKDLMALSAGAAEYTNCISAQG